MSTSSPKIQLVGCEAARRSSTHDHSHEGLNSRWQVLRQTRQGRSFIADPLTVATLNLYRRNVEDMIGTVKVPVGIAGPLHVKGTLQDGEFYVPLATTEATLVASYNRGSQLITAAGGCTARILDRAVARVPGFIFRDLTEVERFTSWCKRQLKAFEEIAGSTTRHGRLLKTEYLVEGNHVYLILQFSTGDAAGQNMVTIATAAICKYINERCPVTPQRTYVEANLSSDKKASAQSLFTVRGRKAVAEITLTSSMISTFLHTTAEEMARYFRISAIAGILSGTIGVQGHYANALAAAYIACGQDVGCVAESAVGVTRFEITESQDLYASVTLPNLIVGTVGGGTALPTQRACLEILGLAGPGHADTFAEVLAALCLAGELSIVGAICAGEFTAAHLRMARLTGEQVHV